MTNYVIASLANRFRVQDIEDGQVMLVTLSGKSAISLPGDAFAGLDYTPVVGHTFDLGYDLIVDGVPAAEQWATPSAITLTAISNLEAPEVADAATA